MEDAPTSNLILVGRAKKKKMQKKKKKKKKKNQNSRAMIYFGDLIIEGSESRTLDTRFICIMKKDSIQLDNFFYASSAVINTVRN